MARRLVSWVCLIAACGGAPLAPRARDVDGVGTFVSVPRGFHTRSYWIEGPEGVVVIDTQFMPSEAERLLDVIERETGKPVVLAIVLHANPDKFNGAEVMRRRGVRVVTSEQVRARIPEVDALRRRWFYERYAPDYPSAMPELESFGDASTEIDAAGLTLRAHVLGAGCSDAHVVIEWNGHVFTGDLIAHRAHAWLELGHLEAWLERLDEIEAMRPRWVHPGRGESGGTERVAAQRVYLERVRAMTREASPALPAPEGAIDALRARIEAEHPGYGYPVFLRVGLPAVWRTVALERAE
ncbi:MBL fold metallo-hydrolase [Sandaracinus amylolyticus]|uniref:MBL fold metallo-hydrolase n=1 Tax=Sandaracinus amylolyticus TaxID=927083 RepID=UPI001F2408A0|nr:MBL fold metallo-hydrolase [Sandaracinus amylolyticus]UJR82454.1 Hypothetical protein I5071_45190 [Sandaracinus amylolyticus]